MANLKFYTTDERKALDSSLAPIKDGQFLIVTDTQKLFYDHGDQRLPLGDVIELASEEERANIQTPIEKFYFVKSTSVLWRYEAGEWSSFASGDVVTAHIDASVRSKGGIHGIRYNTADDAIEIYNDESKSWDKMKAAGGSVSVESVLRGNGWRAGRQSISIPGLKANQNGVIGLTQAISTAALEAVRAGELHVSGQEDGILTISADGEIPTRDIPVVVILLG